MTFTAATITGSGRGKTIGIPTVNLVLTDIPAELEEGIYACTADDQPAVMHYGLRPVFHDTRSCEIHFLDAAPPPTLKEVEVTVVEKIRKVREFPSADALKEEIARDIARTRAILAAHAQENQESDRQ